jgi:hypothetical protein
VKSIRVRLVNDGAQTTDSVYSLKVRLGKPVVDAIAPQTVWVNDDTTFVVTARDTNGTVDSLIINWGDGTAQVKKAFASTITHKYAMAQYGSKTVKVVAKDNDGIYSDTAKLTVNVQLGKPIVSSVSLDTAITKIFINQPVRFFVHGHDNNGRIDSIRVAWNGDTTFSQTIQAKADTVMFSNTFTTNGPKQVRFRVKDDDSLTTDTVISFTVRLGKPKVLAFTPDTAVFIKDSYTYTIAAIDTNGSVDSYWVSWDNGIFVQTSPIGASTVTRALTTAGKHPVSVYVKDNDNLNSDTLHDTVVVRLAAPVIDSMHVLATIWINDTNTYQIFARDTNGTIVKYYFDWTNTGTWQDSGTNATILGGHFSTAGVKTIRFGVLDNDTLLTIETKQVTVHLGAPHIWNPGGDTMFVVCPANGGNIKLGISSYDSSGTIQQYYWNFFGPPYDTIVDPQYKTTIDSVLYSVSQPAVNVAQKIAVFGKDDDGNVGGDTMWLLPDAPPLAPTFFNQGTSSDSVIFKWEKKQDAHDGLKTKLQIYIIQGTSGTPATPLFSGTLPTLDDPRLGSENVGGIQCYTYKFKCSFSGAGRWSVMLQDARGSQTLGNPSISSFVAP